ncbi:hypothetical protein F5141DRAFT_552551 [Pisolithus sp. B1]|nr:hypothetical protein F5141DRAFT_552551 [Pisolithus sp. B1]
MGGGGSGCRGPVHGVRRVSSGCGCGGGPLCVPWQVSSLWGSVHWRVAGVLLSSSPALLPSLLWIGCAAGVWHVVPIVWVYLCGVCTPPPCVVLSLPLACLLDEAYPPNPMTTHCQAAGIHQRPYSLSVLSSLMYSSLLESIHCLVCLSNAAMYEYVMRATATKCAEPCFASTLYDLAI